LKTFLNIFLSIVEIVNVFMAIYYYAVAKDTVTAIYFLVFAVLLKVSELKEY
jgi:hypothetical protein